MAVLLKCVYAEAVKGDGFRILVDRLWPRGLSRDQAKLDLWLKELAPSHELRKWYAHAPLRWEEFKDRYFEELDQTRSGIERLRECLAKGDVTLLFAAKDEDHNNAVALKEYLSRFE